MSFSMVTHVTPEATSTFTFAIPRYAEGEPVVSGDVVVIECLRPIVIRQWPPGWTAAASHTAWRVYSPKDPELVTLAAYAPDGWEVKTYVFKFPRDRMVLW